MVANDFQQGRIWKALFVITEQCRRIDAGENCRLPRSALRPALNAETGVGWNNDSIVDRLQGFIAEMRQGFSVIETVQRIERSPRTDTEAVNEEKKN